MQPQLPSLVRNGFGLPEADARARLLADDPLAGIREEVTATACDLATYARQQAVEQPGLDALLSEYALSSREGVVLMCLAEALLRIPDRASREQLLHDLLETPDWDAHRGHSHSHWVNAVTWGLILTGQLLRWSAAEPAEVLGRLLGRVGDGAILSAVEKVTRELALQFVAGEDIADALGRADSARDAGYRHSFDMLGEAARTRRQSDTYFRRYQEAIDTLPGGDGAAGISVKLSALAPRLDWASRDRSAAEISRRLHELMRQAAGRDIPLTVDAEEARLLETTLEIFAAACRRLPGRDRAPPGLAVQAYQPRCGAVIEWLETLQRAHGRTIAVRLVKGAYWDNEIKFSQVHGHPAYPVFTRKALSDLSFLACTRQLLATGGRLYPQFATHNAHTVASVLCLARRAGSPAYEFQRLHGMGAALHDRVMAEHGITGCRIYAPVGDHRELLPYLVRRLLENGANSSFVHAIANPAEPVERLIAHPDPDITAGGEPRLPLPAGIFGRQRENAPGLFYECSQTQEALSGQLALHRQRQWTASALVDGERCGTAKPVRCVAPGDATQVLGTCRHAGGQDCRRALASARAHQADWAAQPAEARCAVVRRIGELYWRHRDELLSLLVYEGGKTPADALGELREAIDFCQYYAAGALALQKEALALRGPTGESNRLLLGGRGVFACISPWNFPLAIFTGQVVAALVCGNAVLAKPASNTPLVADRAVHLMLEAGVPAGVLHLLPAPAKVFSGEVLASPGLGGVAFTGSTRAAWEINRTLAGRDAPIIPLVAETGGQNAMIVDSSALPEQVVDHVIRSAFNSAGQRCSALRFLYMQEEIAAELTELLAGAIAELRCGAPDSFSTDCGPLISGPARDDIEAHLAWLAQHGRHIATAPAPPPGTPTGHYLPPQAWELQGIAQLRAEVFGPVLHLGRYQRRDLDAVVSDINATGYGLTLGVASRLRSTWERVARRSNAGNIYVNRDIIGATVGVQPFGGNALSGTGPKAGGPHYLTRFLRETTLTVNTTAIGGNAGLLGGGREPA